MNAKFLYEVIDNFYTFCISFQIVNRNPPFGDQVSIAVTMYFIDQTQFLINQEIRDKGTKFRLIIYRLLFLFIMFTGNKNI